MKRLLLFAALIALVGLFIVGCSDDDDDNPVTTGNPEDPNYTLFMDEFDGADSVNSVMFESFFGLVGTLLERHQGSAVPMALSAATVTTEYHDGSQYWYCTVEDYDELEDMTFSMVDSIQFSHGELIVQWPNLDSLTEIKSFLTLTVTGPDIESATAHQDLVVTTTNPGSDTLVVNGEGDIDVTYTYSDIVDNDTTTCSIDLAWTMHANDMMLYVGEESEGPGCPFDGALSYTCNIDMVCEGASEATVTGNWSVVQEFDNGTIDITVSHGDVVWSLTDECEDGDDPLEPIDDSTNFYAFMDQFAGVDDATGRMVDIFFSFADTIFAIEPGGNPGGDVAGTEITLIYDTETDFWHCAGIFDMEDGDDTVTYQVLDSIQFLQGEIAVRYPDPELITEVRSFLRATVTGVGIESATARQDFVLTALAAGSDTLYLTGTGEIAADFSFTDPSTTCEGTLEFSYEADDIAIVPDELADGCPFGGTLTYTGDLTLECTGDFELNLDGTWDVIETFDNGTISYDVTSGDNNWTAEDTCGDM